MTTLRDIAAHFGLSESTVSRILNNTGRVSPSTRERVLAYAAEVDYHPNQLAKSLKRQQSNTVGVMLPDIANEYYALLYREMEERLRRHGLMSILFNTNEDQDREHEFVSYLLSAQVDGMIVATSGSSVYETLSDDMLGKIVFVDNRPAVGERAVTFVGADNVASSIALTEHLIGRGYRRIATLVGSLAESSAQERLSGVRQCLAAHAIDLPEEWVVRTNFLYADGVEQSQALLSSSERPNAVIAQNNVLAYATIRVARSMGLTVPADLAVVCFDHVDVYGFMRPVITTTRQPIDQVAEHAASELVNRVRGGETGAREVILAADFQPGETS